MTWIGGLLALSLGLAACTRASGPQVRPRGGSVRIGVAETGSEAPDIGIQDVWRTFAYEGLIQLNSDGRPQPRLADSWTPSADGLQWRIHIRRGVSWHDGAPLTAESAAEALRRAVEPQRGSALRPGLHDIRTITPEGEDTIVVTLSNPSGFVLDDLDIRLQRPMAGKPDLGTGPFMPVSISPQEIVMRAHGSYHEGIPDIESIVVTPHASVRLAWSELLRGNLDALWNVPGDAVEFLNDKTIDTRSYPRRYVWVMAFNATRPQFRNPVVRHALNAAIDRRRIIESAMHGQGRPAIGPVWPDHWAYDPGVGPASYDLALARAALAGAGYPATPSSKRLRFKCLVPEGFAAVERLALALQHELQGVGAEMHFESVALNEVENRMARGDFDAVILDLVSGPTLSRAYAFWRSAAEQSAMNVFGYSDPDVDRAFDRLRYSANEATVRAATSQLQRALERNPPGIFLAWSERSRALSRRIEVPSVPGRDPFQPYWSWRIRSSSMSQAAP